MHSSRFIALLAAGATALVISAVAVASAGLPGRYETTIRQPQQLKGTWVLTFGQRSTYMVAVNGHPVARGRYSTTRTTVTFAREQGSGCTGAGTYTWKKSGKVVTFVRKRESPSCQARAAVLAHRFTQVR